MRCSVVSAKSHMKMPSDVSDVIQMDRYDTIEKLDIGRQLLLPSGEESSTNSTTTTSSSSTNGIVVDVSESALSTSSSSLASQPPRAALKPMACCVHGCPVNSRNSRYLSFFRFPAGPRCKLWAKFTCRKSLRQADSTALHSDKTLRICSAHFKITDFADPFFRLRLNAMAVPTVFDVSTCPWYLVKDYVPPLLISDSFRTKPGCSEAQEVPFMWDNALVGEAQDNGLGLSDSSADAAGTLGGAEVSDTIDYSDLCAYHRMFVRSVTFVGIELEELKFCIKCGASVKDPVQMATSVFQIKCRRGHSLLVTNELNERCQDWLLACNRRHRLRGDSDPACHSPCHLCDDHFVPPYDRSPTTPVVVPQEQSPPALSNGDCNGTASDAAEGPLLTPHRRIRQVKPTVLPDAFPSLVRQAFQYPTEPSTCDAAIVFDARVDLPPDLSRVESNSKQTQKSDDSQMTKSVLAKQRSFILDLQARVCSLGNRAEELQKKLVAFTVSEDVLIDKLLPRYLSGVTLKMVESQIRLASTKRIRCWPPFMMSLAKIIYSESPAAYAVIRQLWKFPAKETVRRLPLLPKELHSVKKFLRMYFGSERAILKERPPSIKRKKGNVGCARRKSVKVERVPTMDSVVGHMTAEMDPSYCGPLDDQSLSTADEAAMAAEYLLHTEVPFAHEEVTTMTLEEMQTFMQVEPENDLEVLTSPANDERISERAIPKTMTTKQRAETPRSGFAVSNFSLDNGTIVFTGEGSLVYHMVPDDLLRHADDGTAPVSVSNYLFQTSDAATAAVFKTKTQGEMKNDL